MDAEAKARWKTYLGLHKRMVRNVFLNVELLLNDGLESLSEYDVQSLAFLFFARHSAASGFRAEREREGKVDVVVYGQKKKPYCFIEMKTYLKESEKPRVKDFQKDLWKLATMLKGAEGAHGYFLMAVRCNKLDDSQPIEFKFLNDATDLKRGWVQYVANEPKTKNRPKPDGKVTMRLRPGPAERRGRCHVYTWEVKLGRDSGT